MCMSSSQRGCMRQTLFLNSLAVPVGGYIPYNGNGLKRRHRMLWGKKQEYVDAMNKR